MTRPITIQPERADTPEVRAILAAGDAYAAELYPADSNHMLDLAALLEPRVHFLVARVDGVAAATGAVVRYAGYGELKRMFVLPQFRGLGLGRRMLDALLDHLRSQGITLARLETGILNREACALYERDGFRVIGPFGSYVADPLSLFYERDLG
ncbi:MAG: GNAT family N-acetyltransferase [Oscillochloridaceae bacterium umkhey_bin13]